MKSARNRRWASRLNWSSMCAAEDVLGAGDLHGLDALDRVDLERVVAPERLLEPVEERAQPPAREAHQREVAGRGREVDERQQPVEDEHHDQRREQRRQRRQRPEPAAYRHLAQLPHAGEPALDVAGAARAEVAHRQVEQARRDAVEGLRGRSRRRRGSGGSAAPGSPRSSPRRRRPGRPSSGRSRSRSRSPSTRSTITWIVIGSTICSAAATRARGRRRAPGCGGGVAARRPASLRPAVPRAPPPSPARIRAVPRSRSSPPRTARAARGSCPRAGSTMRTLLRPTPCRTTQWLPSTWTTAGSGELVEPALRRLHGPRAQADRPRSVHDARPGSSRPRSCAPACGCGRGSRAGRRRARRSRRTRRRSPSRRPARPWACDAGSALSLAPSSSAATVVASGTSAAGAGETSTATISSAKSSGTRATRRYSVRSTSASTTAAKDGISARSRSKSCLASRRTSPSETASTEASRGVRAHQPALAEHVSATKEGERRGALARSP